jgi:hypothetical protein
MEPFQIHTQQSETEAGQSRLAEEPTASYSSPPEKGSAQGKCNSVKISPHAIHGREKASKTSFSTNESSLVQNVAKQAWAKEKLWYTKTTLVA